MTPNIRCRSNITMRWSRTPRPSIREDDGKLQVYDKTQGVMNSQKYLVSVFGLPKDDLRVLSPYVGGAFGSGLRPGFQVVLAVMGAIALKRSVRVVLTRQQVFGLGYRPASIQRVALGATTGGTLDAVLHDAVSITSQYEDFQRNTTSWAGALYKSPHAKYAHSLARLDLATPGDMRAPGGACGVYALECAMDELAVKLNLDPVELRLRCYSDRDQNADIALHQQEAARMLSPRAREAFGWDKRSAAPRSMRDGNELVGFGMATGIWEAMQMKTSVRITLTANGHAEVACATSDIGTGTYTIMTQVAADMLGLPLANVTIQLGDSTLPYSPLEGGSWTAASVGNAIAVTAQAVDQRAAAASPRRFPHSPLKGAKAGRGRAAATATSCSRQRSVTRGADRGRDAAGRGRPHREGILRELERRRLARPLYAFGDLRRGQGGRSSSAWCASPAWSMRSRPGASSIRRPRAAR